MSKAVRAYLTKAGVDYEIRMVDGPTKTAQDAANQLHVQLQVIIKSVLFTDETDSP